MKTTTLLIFAALGYLAYKVFGKSKAEKAAAAGPPDIFGGIKNGATGTTASVYGFKVPTSGVLGGIIGAVGAATGSSKKDASGGITVDLSKAIKDAGGFFSNIFRASTPGAKNNSAPDLLVYNRDTKAYEPAANRDPSIARERDYQTALATANAAGLGAVFGNVDPFNIPDSIRDPGRGHIPNPSPYVTPPYAGGPIAGRNFSLEDDTAPSFQGSTPENFFETFTGDINADPGESILA